MNALNYKHLRYFWAVAHDGQLTRTAGRLNVSQSALSVQIKQLEDRLGHALFDRRGRQLHLTEAGRITLDHADQIFAAGDELIDTLRDAGQSRKVLRIGALGTLSRNFQIDFLRPVLGRDDTEVVLRSGSVAELLAALETLSLDVILINQAPARDAMTPYNVRRLAEQRVGLIASPARCQNPGHVDVSTLLETHPVIVPTSFSGIRAGFDSLVNRLGIRPQIAAEVDDMALMRLLARDNAGVAVLPPIVVKDELASGQLVVAAELPDVAETFYAVTRQRRFPNPLLSLLLDATG